MMHIRRCASFGLNRSRAVFERAYKFQRVPHGENSSSSQQNAMYHRCFSAVSIPDSQQSVSASASASEKLSGNVYNVSVPVDHGQKNVGMKLESSSISGAKKTAASPATNESFHHPNSKPRRTKQKSEKRVVDTSSTEWVSIENIPPLSTIDDLLVDIERIMQTELAMGIADIDRAEEMIECVASSSSSSNDPDLGSGFSLDDDSAPPQFPMWEPDDSFPPHLVMEAHIKLSTLKRPTGWFLRFPNRSCVHALLSHIDEALKAEQDPKLLDTENNHHNLDTKPLSCAWKRLTVKPFHVERVQRQRHHPFNDRLKYAISDKVVRVENCSRDSDEEDVKYFFERYDLMDDRKMMMQCGGRGDVMKSVEMVVRGSTPNKTRKNVQKSGDKNPKLTPSTTNTFFVSFASSADARCAVREKQNVEFMGRRIRLAQFSRQIFSDDI